jgi:DNA replication protein DnaC
MKIKLNEEIIEYCKILKLKGIRTHFEEVMKEATDYEDFLHKLLTYEMEEKDKRSIDCRIRNAHLPYRQYFEDIEMDCLPVDMQKKLPELATLDFIEKGKNIIMTGNPGTGKTMVSIALGLKACMAGYKVLFTTVPLLVTTLKECNSTKTLRYFENRFEKYDLVIADELGYTSILSMRFFAGSTLIRKLSTSRSVGLVLISPIINLLIFVFFYLISSTPTESFTPSINNIIYYTIIFKLITCIYWCQS